MTSADLIQRDFVGEDSYYIGSTEESEDPTEGSGILSDLKASLGKEKKKPSIRFVEYKSAPVDTAAAAPKARKAPVRRKAIGGAASAAPKKKRGTLVKDAYSGLISGAKAPYKKR